MYAYSAMHSVWKIILSFSKGRSATSHLPGFSAKLNLLSASAISHDNSETSVKLQGPILFQKRTTAAHISDRINFRPSG